MLASLNLLNRFVELPTCPAEKKVSPAATEFDVELISKILTRQGFEVEGFLEKGLGLEQVVVGRIDEARPHPQADRLKICRVDVGGSAPRQIVCGAPNAKDGMIVAVALPGAKLPNGLEIQEASLRGIESRGMLCAREELGLPTLEGDGEGIWDLTVDASCGRDAQYLERQFGKPLFAALGLNDVILDVSVTPNRPDALCHLGIARELWVGLQQIGHKSEWQGYRWLGGLVGLQSTEFESRVRDMAARIWGELREHARLPGETDRPGFSATNGALKFREETFYARNLLGVPCFFMGVQDVEVRPSPGWLRQILESLEQNSVNAVVDLSNFVLLTFGHPSHAFDFAKIGHAGERSLELRRAKPKEDFVGLDGKQRYLDPSDCVVADTNGPQALLGVIGGEFSKVETSTHELVFEIANPDPVRVRRTSRRIGRKTDSSFQFEKGIDRASRLEASALLLVLTQQMSPGAEFVGACASEVDASAPEFLQERVWSDAQILSIYGFSPSSQTAVGFSGLDPIAGLSVADHAAVPGEYQRLGLRQILWRKTSLERVIGAELLSWDEQRTLLGNLGFQVLQEGTEEVSVSVPHWRLLDVEAEADLAEEIIRVVGMDRVPGRPLEGVLDARKDDPHLEVFEKASQSLVHSGYTEVSSFHFMREDDLPRLGLSDARALGEPIRLMNPIIQDEPLLHTTLIPDLLRKVKRNVNYGFKSGQLFHLSRTYQNLNVGGRVVFGDGEPWSATEDASCAYAPQFALQYSRDEGAGHRPAETPRLAGVAFGQKVEKNWLSGRSVSWVLHDVMGHLRNLAGQLAVHFRFRRMQQDERFAPALHPGRSVVIEGLKEDGSSVNLGWLGEIHPEVLRNFEVDSQVFAFEVNMSQVFGLVTQHPARPQGVYHEHRLPLVYRDFALIFEEKINSGAIEAEVLAAFARCLQKEEGLRARLAAFRVFDIYRGTGVAAGQKSIAFQICIEPLEETLSDAFIQRVSAEVLEALQVHLGGKLRE